MSQFTLTLDSGEERVCNYLFKFHDEDTNKFYIFFGIEGTNEVDVMGYLEDEDGLQLFPVEDVKEREMLNEVLADFESHECGCGDDCGCKQENSCSCK